MRRTYYIVWNPSKSEGYITNDVNDATFAATGDARQCFGTPTVGEAFREAYCDDEDEEAVALHEFPTQTIELEV